jgi:hypothetical protein
MTGFAVYRLHNRRGRDGVRARGLSCDEDGVFPAGDVAVLLSAARERSFDFSARMSQLHLVARYMTEGKWILAKIAAVHLR